MPDTFDSMEAALEGLELIDESAPAVEGGAEAVMQAEPVPQEPALNIEEQTAAETAASAAVVDQLVPSVRGSEEAELQSLPDEAGQSVSGIGGGDLLSILDAARQSTENQNMTNLDQSDPATNTLKAQMPEGMTEIPEEMMQQTVQLAAQSFPSMNQVGMLLDVQDRMAYAMSVMGNQSLRSDIKAQIADQVMRDGKILLEALPSDWYEARNLVIPKGQGNGVG